MTATRRYMRIGIKKPEDRLTMAKILVDNDYTVRQVRERRGKGSTYDYYIEFTPNKLQEPAGGENEG